MKIATINSTAKAKKKIHTIAKSNNLDYDLVYAIFCFHWNYDGIEGDWVTDLDQDDDYHHRYELIRIKLGISIPNHDKKEVMEQIYNQLQLRDKNKLFNHFIYGATQKNYCLVSEYASYYYLTNATLEKLNTLEWKSKELTLEIIVKQLFLKLFRGGSIDRSFLEYLYVDLNVALPYLTQTVQTLDWTEPFIEKLEANSEKGKLSELTNSLKEFCKGDKYFLRTVLEALSYSDILKVSNHCVQGVFIPDLRNKLSPHFNSNEWTYPLRFWS